MTHSVDGDGKGKEKESMGSSSNVMLTSHDDGYQELTLTSGIAGGNFHPLIDFTDTMMDASVLDDEEEWRAMSDNEGSICSEEDGEDEEGEDDEDSAEMVIERPFEEEVSSAALLDLSHTETPLDDPRIAIHIIQLITRCII